MIDRKLISGNVGAATSTFHTAKYEGALGDISAPGFFGDTVKPGDTLYVYLELSGGGSGILCYVTGTLGQPDTYIVHKKY